MADFTAAKVSAEKLEKASAQNLGLPETENRTYLAFSLDGADPGEVDVNDLILRINK